MCCIQPQHIQVLQLHFQGSACGFSLATSIKVNESLTSVQGSVTIWLIWGWRFGERTLRSSMHTDAHSASPCQLSSKDQCWKLCRHCWPCAGPFLNGIVQPPFTTETFAWQSATGCPSPWLMCFYHSFLFTQCVKDQTDWWNIVDGAAKRGGEGGETDGSLCVQDWNYHPDRYKL